MVEWQHTDLIASEIAGSSPAECVMATVEQFEVNGYYSIAYPAADMLMLENELLDIGGNVVTYNFAGRVLRADCGFVVVQYRGALYRLEAAKIISATRVE